MNPKKIALIPLVTLLLAVAFEISATPTQAAGATAIFVRADNASEGTWKGSYGADGYSIANSSSTKIPSYAAFTYKNEANWVWASNTSDNRALESGTSGISSVRSATCWFTGFGAFDLDVNLTDGNTHQVALYAMDWDKRGRSETIQVQDANSNAVLSTQSISAFTSGTYLVWNVSGHVIFQIAPLAGPNAVVSGVFFQPTTTSGPTAGVASFVASDTNTQGNWRGGYGADGYSIAQTTSATPSYTSFAIQNNWNWTWTDNTNDPRGLEDSAGSGRIAAAWYGPSNFTMDVNMTDGNTHQFAIYAVDWDSERRAESVRITDAVTNALLDSRSIFSFTNGIYLVWNISGHVTISVTSNSGPNAVVSGIFWGTGTAISGTDASAPVTTAQARTTVSTTATTVNTSVTTTSNSTTSSSSSTLATPTITAAPTKDPAGIFDGNGNFNATAYVNEAAAWGTTTMIPERFGSSWNAYHTTDPALGYPSRYEPASNYASGSIAGNSYFYYTLPQGGTLDGSVGDFSSNASQIAYPSQNGISGSSPGSDTILELTMGYNTWSGVPQLAWTEYGAGHPSQQFGASTRDPYGNPTTGPSEVIRAYGASEYAGMSYGVYPDGQVVALDGGFTANYAYYFKPVYPDNFTPVAASVTNNGEFLMVLGWNTSTYQGQVAVIAISGDNPSFAFCNVYCFQENYPGFRNYSLPYFNKLLGVINLPLTAPTMIKAVGNFAYAPNAQLPGQTLPANFLLSTQSPYWECFVAGGTGEYGGQCTNRYDTAGFMLVASRWERKVVVVNLNPLFQEITAGMFTNFSTFRANVANTGTGPGQWPPTFAEVPSETPTVVSTLSFNAPVTAISASIYPDNVALIATDDDTLRIWSVGNLQTGGSASPSQLYTMRVGNNITSIAYMKHWYGFSYPGIWNDETNGLERYVFIATSRGDKTITWIDLSGGTDSGIHAPVVWEQPTTGVPAVLTDSRIIDPISVEDSNNHGTQSDLLDIADYGASNDKAYRYGPVIYWTNGGAQYNMGATGTDPFEFEGSYVTPTGPFEISTENSP